MAWREHPELGYVRSAGPESLSFRITGLFRVSEGSKIVCCGGVSDADSNVAASPMSADNDVLLILPIYNPLEWITAKHAQTTEASLDLSQLVPNLAGATDAIPPRTKRVLRDCLRMRCDEWETPQAPDDHHSRILKQSLRGPPISPMRVGLKDQILVEAAELYRKHGPHPASNKVCRHLLLDESPTHMSAMSRLTRLAKALGFPDCKSAGRHASRIKISFRWFHWPRQGYRATPQIQVTPSPTSPFQTLGSRSNASRLQLLQTEPSGSSGRCLTPTCSHPIWVTISPLRALNISIQRGSLSRWVRGICERLPSAKKSLVLPRTPWDFRLGATPRNPMHIGIGVLGSSDGLTALAAHSQCRL